MNRAPTAESKYLATAAARFVGVLLAWRSGADDKKWRALGLAAALVLFVGGSILGVLGLPEVQQEPRWELLAIVGLVGLPLSVALSGAEYQVTAAVLGYRVPFPQAVRVGVLATAANMLPIPGAVLVRARAIRKLGGSYGEIALSTGAVAICFVGTACVLAGGVLLGAGRPGFGGVLAGAGALLLALALALLIAARGSWTGLRLLFAAVARATGGILVKAGRLYLVLLALGYDAGATQALTLTIGAAIATALGFFPAGLGAAEALAAALSPLVGLAAAVGFVASAVDRLISMLGLAVITGGILLVDRRRERARSSLAGPEVPPASDI